MVVQETCPPWSLHVASQDLYRLTVPEAQTIPVVVDVPHAGERIPGDIEEITVGDQVLRRDLDLYVDQIWQDAPSQGATLLAANVSRYVVDLNRAADDISPETVHGGRRVSKPGYYQDRGVVWRTTTDGVAVMDEPMSRRAFEERLARFYHPYHSALRAQIERVRDQFGYCILVDGHSMPSVGRRGHHDPGNRRADIVPGDVDGHACNAALSMLVGQHFREDCNYTVAPNAPYKGGFITRHYGQPRHDVHAIQIEVNRDLYMDEGSFVIREGGMERLREACSALLPKLAGLPLS